jgi:hypothetical protein
MWAEVSSSVLHFLQVGLLLNPIIYRCLLKVLCSVSRPITTLDCVLLKDNNWTFVAGSGPEKKGKVSNQNICQDLKAETPQETVFKLLNMKSCGFTFVNTFSPASI